MRELFFHGKDPEANQLVMITDSLQSVVIRAYFTLTIRVRLVRVKYALTKSLLLPSARPLHTCNSIRAIEILSQMCCRGNCYL